MKAGRKTVIAIVIFLMLLPAAGMALLQVPVFQSFICRKITSLVPSLDGRLTFSGVRFSRMREIEFRDVVYRSEAGDTLVQVRRAGIKVKRSSLNSDTLVIKLIAVENANAVIPASSDTSGFDLKALLHADMPWKCIKVRRTRLRGCGIDLDTTARIRGFNAAADNFTLGSEASLDIVSLSFSEDKRGIAIDSFEASAHANDSCISIRDLLAEGMGSRISAPEISLTRNRAAILLDSSAICLGDGFALAVKGSFSGNADELSIGSLSVATPEDISRFNLSGSLYGYRDPDRARADLRISRSHTTVADILKAIAAISPYTALPPTGEFAIHQRIGIHGNLSGDLRRMRGRINLNAGKHGSLEARTAISLKPSLRADAAVVTHGLDLGRLTGKRTFGRLSSTLTGGVAARDDGFMAEITSAEIRSFEVNGYNYSDVTAEGSFDSDRIRAQISSLDSNVRFRARTEISRSGGDTYHINGDADFTSIDFKALNLVNMERCLASALADFNFNFNGNGIFEGGADIRDCHAVLGGDRYDIGDISINSTADGDEGFSTTLSSTLLNLEYEGSEHIVDMISDLLSQASVELSHVMAASASDTARLRREGALRVTTGNLTPLLKVFAEGSYINSGSTLNATIDQSGSFHLDAYSQLLSHKEFHIKNLSASVSGDGSGINLGITSEAIRKGNVTSTGNSISANICDNTVVTKADFGEGSSDLLGGSLNAILFFPDTLTGPWKTMAEILPSTLRVNGDTLHIDPATVNFAPGRYEVSGVKIHSSEKTLVAEGTVSASAKDTVHIDMKSLKLADFNFLLKKDIRLGGLVSGHGTASGVLGKLPTFFFNFFVKDLSADGEPLGNLDLLCKWDETNSRINLLADNRLFERNPLNLVGSYRPENGDFTVMARIDSLNAGWIDPFLVDVVENTKGSVSGLISASGSTGEPDSIVIRSHDLRMNDLHTTLSYTGVPYTLDGGMKMDRSGLTLTTLTITDEHDGIGMVTGGYRFGGPPGERLDLTFDVDNMHGLNTTYHNAGQGFYGNAFADGIIHVYGPMSAVNIDIEIECTSGTVHVPLEGTVSSKRDILTFVQKEKPAASAYDSLFLNAASLQEGRRMGARCHIYLTADPRTQLIVDLNSGQDRARARGNGKVEMTTGDNNFNIKGNYLISEGDCHFSVMGITAKDFTLRDGGTINFNGDVANTDFKISAVYQTKASIETLIGESQAVSTRRTVNCLVNLAGKVSNPEISFKIDIPDLEPTTKGRVENALSTDEKNLRQTMALLVSGGFVPDEQSGIVNNSTILYSNASEILSNQISNIFHQLDIPLDLGFKYQPGNSGINIFDLAISTQLFNNRVSINGNIGNQEYAATGSTSDIVGNVDVEVKLNRSGQLRANVFSHAADRYSNYLDQTQRNGAGIVYQEEFDSFRELWDSIFRRSQRRFSR